MKHFRQLLLSFLLIQVCFSGYSQSPWERIAGRPSTLGLENGISEFQVGPLRVKVVNSSHTLAGLSPVADEKFDYTPDERLATRDKDGLYHLGDINFSLRTPANDTWKKYGTAKKRAAVTPIPVQDLPQNGRRILLAADLGPTLGEDLPLRVRRFWEEKNGQLILRFELTNTHKDQAIEIGSLGIPMIFNNILQDKPLDEAHADNVFFDPYIGMDAGYLQVCRLHGNGPVLLVLPEQNAPFEAYNPLNDDPSPRSIVFEGFHEWMVHSKAHAQTEWKEAEQWNTPTSMILAPGEQKDIALRFVMAPSIRQIEQQLSAEHKPVAIGIPGYVLPQDEVAKLYIRYTEKIKSLSVYPAGALKVSKKSPLRQGGKHLYEVYELQGKTWGRSRVEIVYEDGTRQTIQYKTIKPQTRTVADLGHFLTTTQWYENDKDLFGRSPSVISYDYEEKRHITEESRAWYAGLSDEAGAGSWLAAVMKQVLQPDTQEIARLKRFVHETMWGRIQHKEGPTKYGVRKSLFYYAPDDMPAGTYSDSINYGSWSAWPKKEAESLGRSYNYPHVAAAHWTMYRLARNYVGLVTEEDWKVYLERAFETGMAMVKHAPYYAQFGQMEGSIFVLILNDLQKEGMDSMAGQLSAAMKKRADHWRTLGYPFGSEMPWDSTGQEEVYMWSRYFGYDDKALVTLNAVLAYMPTVPHWGYNGSARRYWDFVYGGKLSRIERQLHHYGSALNAIPVLTAFRDAPDDFYLLRVGHAGAMGALANITQGGFGPAAFHSYPSTLEIDGISGDYGSGFYGYAVNSGTYITEHPEFGWTAFSGNLVKKGSWVKTIVKTGGRSRVFIAPLGLWLTLDAGAFNEVHYNTKTGEINVILDKKNGHTPYAYLRVEQNKNSGQQYRIQGSQGPDGQGRYRIALGNAPTKINLKTTL